jgi:hypothetical protein
MTVSAPDLSQEPPRSGREMMGGYAFLARAADKVRAELAGTSGDYIGFCPFTMGFLDRCGVDKKTFHTLIAEGATDEDLVKHFDENVPPEKREAANRYVLEEMAPHLDEQDAEEGRA